MTDKLLQTIRNWTIRRKILTGFAVVLLVTLGLGAYAIRALDQIHDAASDAAAAGTGSTRAPGP